MYLPLSGLFYFISCIFFILCYFFCFFFLILKSKTTENKTNKFVLHKCTTKFPWSLALENHTITSACMGWVLNISLRFIVFLQTLSHFSRSSDVFHVWSYIPIRDCRKNEITWIAQFIIQVMLSIKVYKISLSWHK